MTALDAYRHELDAANRRLISTVARLSDDDMRAPSLLPGWTRGHVVTHVARNADSHLNLLTWASTGIYTPQYPNPDTRDSEIEAGAVRPAKDQLADLEESAARLAEAADRMPLVAWSATVSGMRPPEHPAWYILMRRLREVEVHHSDLGSEHFSWRDWSDPYVEWELGDSMLSWPYEQSTISAVVCGDRIWDGLGDGPVVEGAARDLLGWISGRSGGEGVRVRDGGELPAPPPWLTQPAPPGLPANPPEE
ncbi:maleylpyruvate isomerase N-terminal domain-containing protein [Streptosporangiaceae bacterium NEAU-GS5]|nr:maleylpyruvate isomerase N-terminal domain-containing protein [Streptosporangiaceae bacterium NEAU-GS5]